MTIFPDGFKATITGADFTKATISNPVKLEGVNIYTFNLNYFKNEACIRVARLRLTDESAQKLLNNSSMSTSLIVSNARGLKRALVELGLIDEKENLS